jgi:serine/threonine-protein kinase
MGIVFLGHDEVLDRPVAIKAMLPPRWPRTRDEQEAMEYLFAEEAKLGANLSQHAHIATVFDYGFHEGLPYTVFEYVEGESVRQLLERRRRLPIDDVLLFLGPVAQALDFAHGRRVVHRDLKPDNIRVTPEGEYKVLDLGLARQFDRGRDWGFAGTPAYASPEQAAEQPIDGRADQYALAVIAFEMLTGRRPFLAAAIWKLLHKHRFEPPPDPRELEPTLTERQAAALRRALSKDPNDRFESCWAFATAMGCRGSEGVVALRHVVLETECRPRFRLLVRQLDRVYLVLTPDALWVGFLGFVRRWPLSAVEEVTIRRLGKRLRVTFAFVGTPGHVEEFRLRRWSDCKQGSNTLTRLRQAEQQVGGPPRLGSQSGAPSSRAAIVAELLQKDVPRSRLTPMAERPAEKSVILLRQHPNLRYQVLGPIEAEYRHARGAEGLLQVRGGVVGADAVLDVRRERRPRFDRTTRHLSGTAVRVLDSQGRLELRARWFQEESALIGGRMLILALFYLVLFVLANPSFWTTMIHGGWAARAAMLAIVVGIHGWHFVSGGFTRWLKWPQLAHASALSLAGEAAAVSAGTILGGLAGFLARPGKMLRIEYQAALVLFAVALPLVIFFVIYQIQLARRVWRAHDLFKLELPDDPPPVAAHRRWAAAACSVYAGLLTVGLGLLTSLGTFVLYTWGLDAVRPR